MHGQQSMMRWLQGGGTQAFPSMAGSIQLIVGMAASLEFMMTAQERGQDSWTASIIWVVHVPLKLQLWCH
jgi:hypothetical protein